MKSENIEEISRTIKDIETLTHKIKHLEHLKAPNNFRLEFSDDGASDRIGIDSDFGALAIRYTLSGLKIALRQKSLKLENL